MSESIILYLLPAFPLLSFGILVLVFTSSMSRSLSSSRNSIVGLRVLAVVLTAFSYSGMLACAIISAVTAYRFDLPFYYLLASFLAYYLSITVLTYQAQRWHELLAGALLDIGSLSLILSVLALLLSAPYPPAYQIALSSGTFLIWYLDHLVRTALTARQLSHAENDDDIAQQEEDQIRRTAVGDTLWYLLKGYKSE